MWNYEDVHVERTDDSVQVVTRGRYDFSAPPWRTERRYIGVCVSVDRDDDVYVSHAYLYPKGDGDYDIIRGRIYDGEWSDAPAALRQIPMPDETFAEICSRFEGAKVCAWDDPEDADPSYRNIPGLYVILTNMFPVVASTYTLKELNTRFLLERDLTEAVVRMFIKGMTTDVDVEWPMAQFAGMDVECDAVKYIADAGDRMIEYDKISQRAWGLAIQAPVGLACPCGCKGLFV